MFGPEGSLNFNRNANITGHIGLLERARAKQLELLEIQRIIAHNYAKCQHYSRTYGLASLPPWIEFPSVPFPDVFHLDAYNTSAAYQPVQERLQIIQNWKAQHHAELIKIAASQKSMPPPPPRHRQSIQQRQLHRSNSLGKQVK